MSIVVYILIIAFGFLIVNHIFEHGFKAIEGMVGENIHSLAGKVGGMGHSISNLKKKLNETLNRSNDLLKKVKSSKQTKGLTKASGTHPSTQSLNLKVKPVKCESFQNQKTLNKLQSDSITHTTLFVSLNGIISNINANIKDIQNEIKND